MYRSIYHTLSICVLSQQLVFVLTIVLFRFFGVVKFQKKNSLGSVFSLLSVVWESWEKVNNTYVPQTKDLINSEFAMVEIPLKKSPLNKQQQEFAANFLASQKSSNQKIWLRRMAPCPNIQVLVFGNRLDATHCPVRKFPTKNPTNGSAEREQTNKHCAM